MDELRRALLQQRGALAANDAAALENSLRAVSRALLTLDEARRRRGAAVRCIVGRDLPLATLVAEAGHTVAPAIAAAREALRQAATDAARELVINHLVLRRALQAGEAYLQRLFSTFEDPAPAYTRSERAGDPRTMLVNRTA